MWAVLDRLGSHSGTKERRAVQQIVALGPGAVPALPPAVKTHRNSFARSVALKALVRLSPRARLVAVRALHDPAMPVRLEALQGLDLLWSRSAARHVIARLRDPSRGVRVNAAAILARRRVRSAVPALVKALKDPKWYVRQQAALALGELGAVKNKKRLQELLSDRSKAVQNAASTALQQLDVTRQP